jgi:hypothetical protein
VDIAGPFVQPERKCQSGDIVKEHLDMERLRWILRQLSLIAEKPASTSSAKG